MIRCIDYNLIHVSSRWQNIALICNRMHPIGSDGPIHPIRMHRNGCTIRSDASKPRLIRSNPIVSDNFNLGMWFTLL